MSELTTRPKSAFVLPPLPTRKELAARFGCTREHTYAIMALPGVPQRIEGPKPHRWRREEIEAWLATVPVKFDFPTRTT